MTLKNPEQPVRAGIYETIPQADEAVAKLVDAGLTRDHISVVCSEEIARRHFEEADHVQAEPPSGDDVARRTAAGGAIGLALGGFAALSVVASGGTSLAAAGALAAAGIAGPFIGAMTSRGHEDEAADFYDQALSGGDILVMVEYHGDDAAAKLAIAEEVFQQSGGRPISLSEG